MASDETPKGVEQILDTPHLAVALESDRFKQFLDQLPIAIAVSVLGPTERICYANLEFERLSGQTADTFVGGGWEGVQGDAAGPNPTRALGAEIVEHGDYLGSFLMPRGDETLSVDAWSNIIQDDDGKPAFRLVALVKTEPREPSILEALEEQLRDKDLQLKELQHRVKNNLQMITALIRVEARGLADQSLGEGFDRLAGRVEALGLLYHALANAGPHETVDLGVYLTEIASAVMRAHAVEGIRLDLVVDAWQVSLDVAMPAGLVVNELLTNSLKHAFKDRDAGTIFLHSKTSPKGCQVIVADDGVGLPEGATWPRAGKLSALIVKSLIQNAKASLDVQSEAGKGMRVVIEFTRKDAAPD